ncbi:MAG: carboxypeptidase-like regulatory domain-containing protein, partial [Bacteroidota bacterium]
MGLFAQGQISGKVTDTDGEALVGASVVVQGTSRGVLTDNEGSYKIQASEGEVLVVSYLGHLTQEVTVGSSSTLNISLEPDEFGLSEVVVTGYATQRKEDLTGSVAVVNTEELTAIPTSNVANQLQGRVAGVNVGSDGRPGAPSKVRIRG